MGIGDFVDKAKDLAAENKDAVKDGIDKAGDLVDEKTGGEHTDKIEQGEEAAKDFVDGLDED
ncbi:MAG: antitoxin [Acidimicrobiia bacterium]